MAGTGPYEGMTWEGGRWTGEPTEAALALRAQQGVAYPNVPGGSPAAQPWTAERAILRRLTGVIYGLLAVMFAVGALSAIPLFGTSAGGLAMLGALAVAGGFGLAAYIKAS